MKVGIVGLGYVGLPLAVAFAEAGHEVVGVDASSGKVERLRRSESDVEDVTSERLRALAARFTVDDDYRKLAACEAVLVCVPTPLTEHREPDLSHLIAAAAGLGRVLHEGRLVVIESTTYPGTTRERLAPILEESGLAAGRDFNLAYSPERIDPGRGTDAMRATPKLVGGLTDECRDRAVKLYEDVCDEIVPVSTLEVAELGKLLENVFRSVNIALVNELAQLCDRLGIDVWEVIDAAATKPFGFMRFEPGPGMGGHCLPVDPFYLAYKAREHDFYTEFVELAGKINQAQPEFCVERIARALNDVSKPVRGSNVLLLGVAYKAGVADLRESPALRMIRLLRERGADVVYHDPHIPELPELGLASRPLTDALRESDLACIVTAHDEVDYRSVVEEAPLVLDLRGVTRGIEAANLVRL